MPAPNSSVHFNGPVELVRMIFNTAAQEDKQTASTLMSVCRSTKDWATPILYETVVLDNRRAARFSDIANSPNALLQNTKNLRVDCLPAPPPGDASFAGLCPSVETLTITNYDLHELPQLAQSMTRLRRVNVKGCMRYAGVVSGAGMENVTHLRFEDDIPRLDRGFVDRLCNLTYFHVKFVRAKKTMYEELERCLGIVLHCERLKKVVIVCSAADEGYLKERLRPWTDSRISYIISGHR